MELTTEQLEIINSSGDIKINAVAGSGKTTTIIEYAKARPASSKILYLAFNKSVKLEAERKFLSEGLTNVQVETAHSLAYKRIVFHYNYKIRSQGYKTNEIAELLNLQGNGEKLTEYIIANHVNKLVAYFCNSNKQKVQDLNYLDTITDKQAKTFVKTFYEYIVSQARLLLSKMDKGEIEITHDFYLKKFQLSNPQLPFDYILFDEGQDASPAMLDVFFKQHATKVIVGDTHQQIYGWRYAVNSLEQAQFKTYYLSTSFRFSPDIAELAVGVLKFKETLGDFENTIVKGVGTSGEIKTKAVIARTNLGLLLKAIEYVTEQKNVNHIYFEGNINSYTYATDGASLYDVLNLSNQKNFLIKDKLLKGMSDMNELEEYIDKSGDTELSMMIEIVKEYGNKIPDIIKQIKAKHVDNDDKEKAEMIFSTVHRSKGMEYDTVQLVDDFITEEKLKSLIENTKEEVNISKLNEEINMLYVAVTRTKNNLYIPTSLMPVDFPASPFIHLLKVLTKKEKEQLKLKEPIEPSDLSLQFSKWLNTKRVKKESDPEKSNYMQEAKAQNKSAYQPWTPQLDKELTSMYKDGINPKDLARHFGAQKELSFRGYKN